MKQKYEFRSTKNRRTTGACFESEAAGYLEEHDYKILEKNYRCRIGEIDLIAQNEGYLVFIEVKYRKTNRLGEGEYAVNYSKQKRIEKSARWYCMEHGIAAETPCRFDVVTINGSRIHLLKNAFECKC